MHTISPYLAEFLGTLIMCTIGCGAIATVELRRSKGHGDNFFTIAFGWFCRSLRCLRLTPVFRRASEPRGLCRVGGFWRI